MGVSLAVCSFLGEALGLGGCKKGTREALKIRPISARQYLLYDLYIFLWCFGFQQSYERWYIIIYHHISHHIIFVGSFNRSIFQL
jgi:hypothetical protein